MCRWNGKALSALKWEVLVSRPTCNGWQKETDDLETYDWTWGHYGIIFGVLV